MSKFLFSNNPVYRTIRHLMLIVFAIAFFALIIFFRIENRDFGFALGLTTINAFFFFAYGYLTVFLLIPFLLFKRYYVLFVIAFILSGFLLSFLKLLFSDFVFASSITEAGLGNNDISGWRYLVVNTKDMSFIVAVFSVVKYAKDWLYAEKQRKELEVKNAEARLRLLQSQINPHFLFNTLNNLYSLSIQKSGQTLEVIKRLKLILRYLLVDIQGSTVALKDEIELIKHYMYIEQLRYGDRLKVDIKVRVNSCNSQISPMLFFPIIDNCLKHGSSIDAGTPWIKLKFECAEGILTFKAANSIPPSVKAFMIYDGSGIKNLKRRLELLYPKSHWFQAEKVDGEYRVELKIDLR